jgi:hypothetical protein
MACLPLLPQEHIHRAGIEGRTTPLVHAHTVEYFGTGSTQASLARGHGDHGLATFLTNTYDGASRVTLQPALQAAGVVTVTEFRVIGRADPMLTQTAHGPPRSAWLTRGPPSLS